MWAKPKTRIANLERIRKLIQKRIFEPSERGFVNDDPLYPGLEVKPDRSTVLFSSVRLNGRFIKRILGETGDVPTQTATPYKDNEEFIREQFAYVEALQAYRTAKRSGWDHEAVTIEAEKAEKWERHIGGRLEVTDHKFPLLELAEEYQLDRDERTILIYMLKEEFNGNRCTKDELLDLISENPFDRYRKAAYLESEGRLMKNNLIEKTAESFFNLHSSLIYLPAEVTARLVLASSKTGEVRIEEIIGSGDLLSLSQPKVTLDQLVLPAAMIQTLQTALAQCRGDVSRRLQQWGLSEGIFSRNRDTDGGDKPSLLLLFHGPPGTGKTFAAEALAGSLGKKLLVTDISRILSHWVGQSEKNLNKLFAQYETIVRRSDNPPILLLNECDQFLTARGSAQRAVDRMYNQMQNLFLEALERFQGVLIATTNLRENLDKAFSRRFHLKLEFPFPGVSERRRLWEVHLPETLPLDDDVDVDLLAGEFALTGGQIAVVVKNAAVEAARKGEEKIGMALLRKFACLESGTSFDRSHRRIGFNPCIFKLEDADYE